MASVYVVRHGVTDLNKQNRILGHLNADLSMSSEKEIDLLAQKLKNISFEIIYSSDLKRAVQTAKILNRHFGCPIIKDKRLREVDYGLLEGMKKSEAAIKYSKYHKDVNFVHPMGESFANMDERVISFLKDIQPKKRTLVVTHSGCIRSIISYLKNEPLQDNIEMNITHNIILKCIIDKKKSIELL